MKYKTETAKRIISDLKSDGMPTNHIAKVLKEALHICGVVQPEANCKITVLATYECRQVSESPYFDDYKVTRSKIVQVENLEDLNEMFTNLVHIKILK